MELGVSRFVFADHDGPASPARNPTSNRLEEMELTDQVGLDIYGIGEHHTREFLVSVGSVPLAQRLRGIELLGTAVAPQLRG